MSELKHYGVLGMKWGRRIGRKVNSLSNKKGKIKINTKKVINGRNLADDVLKDIGTLAVTRLAGRYLMGQGQMRAGIVLASIGTMYTVTTVAGDILLRTEREDD